MKTKEGAAVLSPPRPLAGGKALIPWDRNGRSVHQRTLE